MAAQLQTSVSHARNWSACLDASLDPGLHRYSRLARASDCLKGWCVGPRRLHSPTHRSFGNTIGLTRRGTYGPGRLEYSRRMDER
jgi:hypothetical protein